MMVQLFAILFVACFVEPKQLPADKPHDPLPRDEAIVAKVMALVRPDRFRTVDTAHFTIVHDLAEDAAAPLARRAEATFASVVSFCERLTLPTRFPSHRLTIVVFDAYDDFLDYSKKTKVKDTAVAGYFDPSMNAAVFVSVAHSPPLLAATREIDALSKSLDAGKFDDSSLRSKLVERLQTLHTRREALIERFHQIVIQHEIAHQLFFNFGIHVRGADNPAWLVEGLACQFETPADGLGDPARPFNHPRLADFRDILRAPPDAFDDSRVDWRRAFQSGPFAPIKELIALDSLAAPSREVSAARYAQAWALVRYLHQERGDDFAKYLRQLAGRKPDVSLSAEEETVQFEAAFGPLNENAERDLVRFVLGLPLGSNE